MRCDLQPRRRQAAGAVAALSTMRQLDTVLDVATPGRGLVEITRPVAQWTAGTGIADGLLTLFIRHTSASLLVQENADPQVRRDLERFLARLVPDGDPLFEHQNEGPDDMPAHVRSALTQVQLSVPLIDGRLALGTWQGIYVYEHRRRAHTRQVVLHLIGD
jgi:secondary thiamine-phosphate synthase enzyme